MDFLFQLLADKGVNQLMPLDSRQALKSPGDNNGPKMAFAPLRDIMLRAFVDHLEMRGLKPVCEFLLQKALNCHEARLLSLVMP